MHGPTNAVGLEEGKMLFQHDQVLGLVSIVAMLGPRFLRGLAGDCPPYRSDTGATSYKRFQGMTDDM